MIGLAVLAVLLASAGPGLAGFAQRGGVDSAARALIRSTAQARSVAVQQGRTTALRLSQSAAQVCGSGTVAAAWLLQSTDAAGTTDTLECLSQADLQSRYGVTISVASAPTLRFNSVGLADNAAAVDVTFSRGSRSAVVRIYPGGTARVL